MALALVAAAVAAGGAYLVSLWSTPVFEGRASLILAMEEGEGPAAAGATAPRLSVETYASAISSRTLISQALAGIQGAPPTVEDVEMLRDALDVRTEIAPISALLHIAVRDPDPERARDAANELASTLVAWDAQRAADALEARIENLQAQLDAVRDRSGGGADAPPDAALGDVADEVARQLAAALALRGTVTTPLSIFEVSGTPVEPVAPRPVRNALIAAVVAVVLVYGLLMMRNAIVERERYTSYDTW